MPIIGDVAYVLEELIRTWKAKAATVDKAALKSLVGADRQWRAQEMPQLQARSTTSSCRSTRSQRLYELTKDRDVYITTEVGQHQMWAAQFFRFEEPNRWMTSGGLGTMGYGLPAAIGAQMAHPKSLVIDIAGDASILMNIQEMSTAVQYRLPVKVFILNNQYMGMVRQWQQLLHGNRISESYTESLPDFVKLAEAYGGIGMRCEKPAELDDCHQGDAQRAGRQAGDLRLPRRALANCFPMIPSGKAHQRDAARRGRHRRGDREGDRQGRQGAGVDGRTAQAVAAHGSISLTPTSSKSRMSRVTIGYLEIWRCQRSGHP